MQIPFYQLVHMDQFQMSASTDRSHGPFTLTTEYLQVCRFSHLTPDLTAGLFGPFKRSQEQTKTLLIRFQNKGQETEDRHVFTMRKK